MFFKSKRLLSIAVLLSLSTILLGTWWVLSDRNAPEELQLAAGSAPAGMETTGFSGPARPGPIRPVVVNLADIAPGQFDVHNKRDRWLRGEVDFSKRRRLVSTERFNALRAASPFLPPSLGVQNADDTSVTDPSSATPGSGIESIDYTGCCGGGGNVPPDPEMAAGPNHLIAVVNVAFEIYDKSGNSLQAPTTFSSFMGASSSCANPFDPNVLYDEEADRFIMGVATTGGSYCIAVSQTEDPMGGWNLYALPTYVGPGPEFFDYPHAGVGEDAIYIGANIFGARNFKTGRIFALDKLAMYAGDPTPFVVRSLGKAYDTPQPLNLHGVVQGTWPDSGRHYFFSDKDFNGRTYAIHSWTDPFGANTFTEVGEVDLNAATGVTAGLPLNVPQQTGGTVDGGDWRPQDFEYRNGYGWTVMTIACNPGDGTVNCVRWAKIDLATATVADAGVYAGNGTYRSYADLAANACDDMAVGYTKSDNTDIFPSIWYTGRLSDEPAGKLHAETMLKEGAIEYTSFEPSAPRRWGDYTGMTIDPDGTTFWYLGEYSKDTGTTNGRWGTYIGSFSYDCDPLAPSADPPPDAVDDAATLAEDGSVVVEVLANDEAALPPAALTVTGVSAATNGGVVITGGGTTVTYTHDGSETNSDSFTYTVTEDSGGSATATVTITVTPVDDAPVAADDTAQLAEGASVVINVLANDSDPDSTMTVTEVSTATNGDVAVSGGGSTVTYNSTGGTGADSFTYTINDGNGGSSDTATVDVTVNSGGGGGDMHVGGLVDGGSVISGRRLNKWTAMVDVTVHGPLEALVEGATVSGTWSNGAKGGGSCITVAGLCTVTKNGLKLSATSATFTVTDVTHATLSYVNTVNHDPAGPSPAITVDQP